MIFKDDEELHSKEGVELFHIFHGVSKIMDYDEGEDGPVHFGTIKNHELLFLANERIRRRFDQKKIRPLDVYYSLNYCNGDGLCEPLKYGPLLYNIKYHYSGASRREMLIKNLIRIIKVRFVSPEIKVVNYNPGCRTNNFYIKIDKYKQKPSMTDVIEEALTVLKIPKHTKSKWKYPEGIVLQNIKFMNCEKYIIQFPVVGTKK